jgi:hypothetical protein
MFWIMGADALGGIAAAMTNGQTGWTRHVAEHLEHVPWAGFHFYDLIFPLFLFIAGVSLVYSLGRAVEEKGRGEAMVRLLQRGLLALAAAVEVGSHHPVALAIVAAAGSGTEGVIDSALNSTAPQEFSSVPGLGVRGVIGWKQNTACSDV